MWNLPEKRQVAGYHADVRGFFTRLHDSTVDSKAVQSSAAFSKDAGTLRGLHFLRGSRSEEKRLRVLTGAILDFALDIRLGSPSYGTMFQYELLSPDEELVIPKHFAHGYLTLEPNTIVTYLVDEAYDQSYDAGYRFNQAQFNLKLPIAVSSISERDASLPTFRPGDGEAECRCCPKSTEQLMFD